MKKNLFNIIVKFIIILIFLGIIFALCDYFQVKSGNIPIFNISKVDDISMKQVYQGIFHKIERKLLVSPNESLHDSDDLVYSFLIFDFDIKKIYKNEDISYQIDVKENKECHQEAKLYYLNGKTKIYTYCFDNINVIKDNKKIALVDYLKKDKKFIGNFYQDLLYLGFNQKYELYSGDGFDFYKCNIENSNDYYFVPKGTLVQPDFCTYKEDEYKLLFKIVEENTDNTINTLETFYEDESYYYEFDEVKSDRVYIVIPSLDGSSEIRYTLKEVLNNKMLSIDELESKGLKFNKRKKVS